MPTVEEYRNALDAFSASCSIPTVTLGVEFRVDLSELIRLPSVSINEIAQTLDQLDPGSRWDCVSGLSRDEQRTLYEKAGASPAIELDHFVDGVGEEVVHQGLNTLPVAGPLRRFEKRFVRADTLRAFGYNEGITRRFVGPGFFVAESSESVPHWQQRGAIVIDYYKVPEAAAQILPSSWPAVKSNDRGLQRFVYSRTRDFMRKVSEDVSIGAAYKEERPLDHYFVLCRR